MPRGATQAKGLLLSCIDEPDPCIIFEPKILYRTAIDEVPVEHYKIEIGKAEIVRAGKFRNIRHYLDIKFCIIAFCANAPCCSRKFLSLQDYKFYIVLHL